MINTIKKITILTSATCWFIPYAQQFKEALIAENYQTLLHTNYDDIPVNQDVVFMLNYFKIVSGKSLRNHKLNLVVHESSLPQGKGYEPLIWQVIEGKNNIPIVLFQATEDLDAGDILLKDEILFNGTELYDEIRHIQATKTIQICQKFLKNHSTIIPQKQHGESSFYLNKTIPQQELDITKSLQEHFNTLRISSIKKPAFFYYQGKKYEINVVAKKERKLDGI